LWQRSLFMAGLLLALIAAARPQWGMKEDTVYQRGRDLMIVLDVSRSMLANDVHPSRLGRAKVDLIDLIRQLRGDRVGLLAFRGRPLLLCPLTTDYGFLSQTLEGAAVDSAPAGETDIGDAVLEALNNFQGDDGSHRAIVLVSDGEDLAGKVTEAIAKAKEQGVALFTVGFGSTAGASVPSAANKKEAMNYQGQEVVSKLNHEVLRDLAEKTGGAYVPVGLANVKLGDLYRNHLSRINARDLEESVQRRAIERYQWFLFPAALCFIGLAFFSRGQIRVQKGVFSVQYSEVRSQESEARSQNRESRVQSPESRIQSPESPTPPPVPQAMVLLLLLSGIWGGDTVLAQTNLPAGREGARVAQKLYLIGQYAESAEAYQAAAKTAATANRDDYLFNAGCALLKAGKPDDAADLFRNLTGIEGARGAAAAYNLGCSQLQSADSTNTEHRVQSLQQAGLAFQKVLQQNSTSRDALKNLAITASLTPEAEEQARISRLMAEHGQSQPGALADTMLLQQRKLVEDIPAAFTNTTPTLIESLESLATAQDQTTELMIPLKGKLLQALSQQAQQGGPSTNAQQQIAQVNAFAEAIRDQLSGISASLRDLDRSATPLSVKAEESLYTLWKGLAGYPQLLREDIQRQTNAITLNEKPSGWTATSGRGQTPPGGRRPP
ncbi:MAG: VWA domain-containing protein, partial [bacterium]